MNYSKIISVPWQVQDSAVAKLAQVGASALSDPEVISVAAGITLEQSRTIFLHCGNDLRIIAKLSIYEIAKISGITQAKAIRLAACFELGRRKRAVGPTDRVKVRCSQDAYKHMGPRMEDLQREEFWILLLNRSNQIIDTVMISQGGISGTVTDVRLILNASIEKLASGIILCHNHPSGNLSASEADLKITKKIKEAAQLMDLSVLDHLILSDQGYLSMADDNLMP
jgi:DNA repair protein RadC